MISRRNNGSARGRPRSPPRGAPHPQPQRKATWVLIPVPAPIPALFPPGGLTCSISRLNWASRGLGSRRVGAPGTLRPTLLGVAGSLLPGLSLWGASWGGRGGGQRVTPSCCLGASRRGHTHGVRYPGSPRGGQRGAEQARETPSPSKRDGGGGGEKHSMAPGLTKCSVRAPAPPGATAKVSQHKELAPLQTQPWAQLQGARGERGLSQALVPSTGP